MNHSYRREPRVACTVPVQVFAVASAEGGTASPCGATRSFANASLPRCTARQCFSIQAGFCYPAVAASACIKRRQSARLRCLMFNSVGIGLSNIYTWPLQYSLKHYPHHADQRLVQMYCVSDGSACRRTFCGSPEVHSRHASCWRRVRAVCLQPTRPRRFRCCLCSVSLCG